MKKDDNNKVLKRILFLFIFVFVSASIILLKPNTLSKLQGNASSYNQENASYEETGVVVTTDYLIEDLTNPNLKLTVYNGSNSDITITNFISKKIDPNSNEQSIKYIKNEKNETIKSKETKDIYFSGICLGGTYENGTCSNEVLKINDNESIEYKNVAVGIEYKLNNNNYYLASTVLYLDTSKLTENNINSILNLDNTKSESVDAVNVSINDSNDLVISKFVDEEDSKFENINLTGEIIEEKKYDYIVSSNTGTIPITYNFSHDKYLFLDTSEASSIKFNGTYTFDSFDSLENNFYLTYFDKFLIVNRDNTNNTVSYFDYKIEKDYSPKSDIINIKTNGYSPYYYRFSGYTYKKMQEKEFTINYSLDTTSIYSDIFLKEASINHFYRLGFGSNNDYALNVISSPVVVTTYNKNSLKLAILNGIDKLKSANEDSIDVNSYLDYTDLLITAIDLYSSRYVYKVNGNDYLVNSANIYSLTNILNNYEFKEKPKADYTEVDKKIELACDVLSKYESSKNYKDVTDRQIVAACKNATGKTYVIKSSENPSERYFENTNKLREIIYNLDRNLSINYQSYLDNEIRKIDAQLIAFPVYIDDYMDIYNTAIDENPKVKTILLDEKKYGETINERFRLLINKFNEEQIKVSLDNLKDYLFNGIMYESFYYDGPEEYLYPEEAWNNYYSELSKFYGENTKPDFESMNLLEHQNIINESTENLKNAIKTLEDNVKVVDTSIMSDLIDLTNQGSYNELAALLSKDTYNEIINIAKTLNKKLPINKTSKYNGMDVNNQAYFYNCIIDIYLRIQYDMIFNVDIDGLTIDGRNSREDLGYLTVEEYYNFFYNLNYEDYDMESLETVTSTKTFEDLSEFIEFNEVETLDDRLFKKTFAEWYLEAIFVDVTFEEGVLELVEGAYFGELQMVTYKLQDDFKYLKNLLTPKVGDYTEICNYYKVLTSLNLNYYESDTKNQIVNALWNINWSYKKDEQDKIDEQARELKEFIDGLSMRKADTNKLYEAYNNALKYDKDLYSNYADLEEALLGFKYLNNVYVDRQGEVDILTNKINKAVKGLSLKKANYTKIEYLKSKISNLDPERYENFYLVNNALNNIVYGLDITKQKEVDEMYNKLLEAFESLKRNGNDPADYTEYNKIVSSVPTFVKGYDKEKQEKINNLKKEINDFPMNLKLKEQSRIDNMVVKIKKVLNDLNINYSSNLEVVTPVDTTLIKNIKINGNAIDISRMPFDYSVEYADKSANIEVEVIKNAKVFVYGGAALSYGENSVKIEVIYLDKIYNYELNIYRKSSSNYLKELKINTKGASFNSENFNKEKQDYIVKINNDVTRLDIEAIPEEETAKINIKNNYKLKDDSRVQIEVTSKDGSFRIYTLIIKKTSVVNYTFLIVLAVIFALLAVALKGLQNLSKKKSENE